MFELPTLLVLAARGVIGCTIGMTPTFVLLLAAKTRRVALAPFAIFAVLIVVSACMKLGKISTLERVMCGNVCDGPIMGLEGILGWIIVSFVPILVAAGVVGWVVGRYTGWS